MLAGSPRVHEVGCQGAHMMVETDVHDGGGGSHDSRNCVVRLVEEPWMGFLGYPGVVPGGRGCDTSCNSHSSLLCLDIR